MASTKQNDDVTIQMKRCAKACVLVLYSASLRKLDVCVFGYYGHGCIKECSKFCNKSRDCNPVSGFCNGGCRNGKKGSYCQEVDIPVAYHAGGACGEYIEFREGNTDNPYDRIQERSNFNSF
uniref:Uncharacterized protein n=1 Tax=Magallana gigas TaxID=29159 RepID=K1QQB9_MAGGI